MGLYGNLAEMEVFLIGKLPGEGNTIALSVLKPLNDSAWMPWPGCGLFNNTHSCSGLTVKDKCYYMLTTN